VPRFLGVNRPFFASARNAWTVGFGAGPMTKNGLGCFLRFPPVGRCTLAYIDRPKNMFRFEVGPGASEDGQVIFKVAPDASRFRLQLGARNPFSNNSGYVNLGF